MFATIFLMLCQFKCSRFSIQKPLNSECKKKLDKSVIDLNNTCASTSHEAKHTENKCTSFLIYDSIISRIELVQWLIERNKISCFNMSDEKIELKFRNTIERIQKAVDIIKSSLETNCKHTDDENKMAVCRNHEAEKFTLDQVQLIEEYSGKNKRKFEREIIKVIHERSMECINQYADLDIDDFDRQTREDIKNIDSYLQLQCSPLQCEWNRERKIEGKKQSLAKRFKSVHI